MYDSVYIYIYIYMYTKHMYDFSVIKEVSRYQNEAQVPEHVLKLDVCDNFRIQAAAFVQWSSPPFACKEFEHRRNSDDGNSLEFVSAKSAWTQGWIESHQSQSSAKMNQNSVDLEQKLEFS